MMINFYTLFHRYSLIKQIPIFKDLPWLDLQKIARKTSIVDFKKGETICRQNDPPDALYCLVSGRIQAYTMSAEGKKTNVELIRRGMHFGVISLLTGKEHSLSYEAINDSVLLRIVKKDFENILQRIPRLGIAISQSLSKRIGSQSAKSKSVFESSVISIYSPMQGTGSSTYAVNLAVSLQRESQKKVILVNISSALTMTRIHSSDVKEATPHWKRPPIQMKDLIYDYEELNTHISSGELAIDLINVNFNHKEDPQIINQISRFVSALAHEYHFVVVDLPNEMNNVVLTTLIQSDLIQLITLDSKDDLKRTRQVIDELAEGMKENFHLEKIQVIISGIQDACYLSYEDVNREIDFDVYSKLPHIHPSQMTISLVSEDMSVIIPDPNSEYARIITRIARKISGMQVGLVLGGGAALGVAHIGVLRVLEQEKIPIDVVVGSSMGALIGAFWTTGKSADDLEKIAREFESVRGMLKLLDPVLPKSGIIGGRAIKQWLQSRGLKNKTFYSTKIPLKIIAYDIIKRHEIILDAGSLVDAVRQSIAIPGVIEPIIEHDQVIIDGGVLNPLPTNVLTGMGIKKIIAVNVLQSPEHVTKGFLAEQERLQKKSAISFTQNPWWFMKFRCQKALHDLFTPTITDIIVRSLQASEYVISQQSAVHANVVIHPDLSGISWFELYKVADLIQRGEEAARQCLPSIKTLVQESS
jgi:NTE family protein